MGKGDCLIALLCRAILKLQYSCLEQLKSNQVHYSSVENTKLGQRKADIICYASSIQYSNLGYFAFAQYAKKHIVFEFRIYKKKVKRLGVHIRHNLFLLLPYPRIHRIIIFATDVF